MPSPLDTADDPLAPASSLPAEPGERERQAATMLAALGFQVGPCPEGSDAPLGQDGARAVAQFQAEQDLPTTGELDAATMASLVAVTGEAQAVESPEPTQDRGPHGDAETVARALMADDAHSCTDLIDELDARLPPEAPDADLNVGSSASPGA